MINSEDKRREDMDKRENINANPDTENKNVDKKLKGEETTDPAKMDPAKVNPKELASFPEEKENENPDIEAESESNLVNKKSSPVREKRNITRTGPTASPNDGFM